MGDWKIVLSGPKAALFAASVVAVVATGCGGADTSVDGDAAGATTTDEGTAVAGDDTPADEADPIVLGMVLSETGPASTLGEFQARGVRLAVEEINEAGGFEGRPIELLERDDQSDPERAVTEVTNLIAADVDGIVGPSVTATCYAIEPVVREEQMPTYCLSGAPEPEGNEYMFMGLPHFTDFASAHLPWMSDQGHDALALLHSTDATGNLLGEQLPKLAEGAGIETVGVEEFDLEAGDVTSQLTALRRAEPDVLYIGTTGGGPSATALRSLRDLGWEIPVVLTWSNATEAFRNAIEPVAPPEAYIGGLPLYTEAADEQAAAFVELYESQFDDAADMYSASGYDAVNILVEAVTRTNGGGEAIREFMIDELGTYEGASGDIDFTEDDLRGFTEEAVILMRVTSQGYVRVGS